MLMCGCGGNLRVTDGRMASGLFKRRRFCDSCPERITTYEVTKEYLDNLRREAAKELVAEVRSVLKRY